MNKSQLKEYLSSKFEVVLENSYYQDNSEHNKQILEITPKSRDDKCYVSVADLICMNKKKEKFYFLYYGKKNTTLMFDDKTKTISVRLENNAIKRNQYDSLLKKIKKEILTSNSYLVFFTISKIEPSGTKKILIANEENIDSLLFKYYDN